MSDNLRYRIAAAIYDASDEYARKLMVRPDCPGASELEGDSKPVCYTLADAVIRELGLETVELLARSWYRNYDIIPANDPRKPTDADIAYNDAGLLILDALGLPTGDPNE